MLFISKHFTSTASDPFHTMIQLSNVYEYDNNSSNTVNNEINIRIAFFSLVFEYMAVSCERKMNSSVSWTISLNKRTQLIAHLLRIELFWLYSSASKKASLFPSETHVFGQITIIFFSFPSAALQWKKTASYLLKGKVTNYCSAFTALLCPNRFYVPLQEKGIIDQFFFPFARTIVSTK